MSRGPATLLVATGSAHKLVELRRLFGGISLDVLTLRDVGVHDEAPEDGATFEENALQKARWYANASGLWTLADDSGLEVFALEGAPGVFTRRYAGPKATDVENYEKLLVALAATPDGERGARFVCVMALVDPVEHTERTFRGEREGVIAHAPRGTHGFGYDPVFEVDGRTMAERSAVEKDALSHRGAAAAQVAAEIPALLAERLAR